MVKKIQGNDKYSIELVNRCLAYFNIENCELPFAIFHSANLNGSYFKNVTLYNANLCYANMFRTVFVDCFFESAKFNSTKFYDVTFKNCFLHGADYRTEYINEIAQNDELKMNIKFIDCILYNVIMDKNSEQFRFIQRKKPKEALYDPDVIILKNNIKI